MKEKLKYYTPMVDFIVKSHTFPSYNSIGVKCGVMLPMSKAKLVSDLSYLLGKMEMCVIHNDQENFDALTSIFRNACSENDIVFEAYDEYLNDQED